MQYARNQAGTKECMSDNSVIYLFKVADHYEIVHADADSNVRYKTVKAKTAEDALAEAQKMQDSTFAEYMIIDVIRSKEVL